ncbi:hypothetical protein [Devosia sp. 919]|uniref:hypothetical protein n=1 Tax=Devosia sp. 919 TaxID=2726065 RepID=UPI0015576AC0|nr:hypothetical protein [Devosia sp. 919]
MIFDRRLTNGLAWAGLFVVVGVPVADMLSAQLLGEPERVAVISPQAPIPAPAGERPTAKPVKEAVASAPTTPVAAKPAAIAPVKAESAAPAKAVEPVKPVAEPAKTGNKPGDPVNSFLESGKAMPSYITEANAAPQASPAQPTAPAPVVAPAPAPAVAAAPLDPAAPGVDPVEVASLPPQKVAPVPMPLSMRPPAQIAVAPSRDEPVIIPPDVVSADRGRIDADDLEDWESGPLSEFLNRRQGGSGRTAGFEEEFYPEEPVRRGRDRLIGPVEEVYIVPFR